MFRTVDNKLNKKGFSLAELLIVVAIVVIIAGVSIPLFSMYLKNYREKQTKDIETAAKAAAVSAFYSGYDSKGNKVKISDTGVCTFLYDAENSAVYVLNSQADAQTFSEKGYGKSIENYGIKVSNDIDHSGDVILVTFDGRYYLYKNDAADIINRSKGTFEEPALMLDWYPASSLLKKQVDV